MDTYPVDGVGVEWNFILNLQKYSFEHIIFTFPETFGFS
jgi:hypothetical protein